MKNVLEMLAAADAAVPRISSEQARRLVADERALIVDVRETAELAEGGMVTGAVHIPRGMLEFRADPESPFHDINFERKRAVILYCAAGARAALAGLTLKEMGFTSVYNLGAFEDWRKDRDQT